MTYLSQLEGLFLFLFIYQIIFIKTFIYKLLFIYLFLFTDLAQEAGIRYISQLEMDLMSLKHRLHYAYPEMTNKPTNCACAEMEKHFMKMATSAYQSIRRYDGTMNSFDRFKQELTQTNQVIKDSMELLQNVRRLCVH